MENYQFVADKITQVHSELGLTNYAGFFETALDGISDLQKKTGLTAFDLYNPASETERTKEISHQIRNESGFHVIEFNSRRVLKGNHFPELIPLIALFIANETITVTELLDRVSSFRNNYSLYLVIDCNPSAADSGVLKRQIPLQANLEYIRPGEDPSFNVIKWLSEILDKHNKSKLATLAMIRVLQPVIDQTNQVIKAEHEIVSTQKLLLSQESNAFRGSESMSMNSELSNQLRQLVQKNIIEPEKGFKLKYDELNKPNTGQFTMITDNFCRDLRFEDLAKVEVAEKNEKIETRLSEQVKSGFLKSASSNLLKEFNRDLAYCKESLAESMQKTNRLLAEKGIAPLQQDSIIAIQPQPEKIISSHNYLQREYSGEITKKGVMEYFIALRDYTGVIMVVVGIFGPLTMLSSFPSDEKEGFWAFLSKISNHLKQFKIIIQIITILTILFMIVYGIYDLRRRIPRKREEEKDKEIKKARESLQQEGRRINSDSARDWTTALSNYMKDYAQGLTSEADAVVRGSMVAKQQQVSGKRNDMMIHQQSLEHKLRGIQSAERIYDSLRQRFTEIKQKLTS